MVHDIINLVIAPTVENTRAVLVRRWFKEMFTNVSLLFSPPMAEFHDKFKFFRNQFERSC